MKKKLFFLIIPLCLILCLSGRNYGAKVDSMNGSSDLGFQLLHTLLTGEKNDTLLISPYSLFTTLAMVLNGAEGETREEIVRVMKCNGVAESELNSMLLAAADKIDRDSSLHQANSVWVQKGFKLKKPFEKKMKKYYKGALYSQDFAKKSSVDRINSWVDKQTKSRIPRLLDTISADAQLILINALYFKEQWMWRFDPALTSEKPFYNENGKEPGVPMMAMEHDFLYFENSRLKALAIPYRNSAFSMHILMPQKEVSLTELSKELDSSVIHSIEQGYSETKVTLELPRFKIEYGKELKESLEHLGMKRAFTESAEFTAMAHVPKGMPFYISKVTQKCFMEVAEAGTEAAAATKVEMILGATLDEQEPVAVTVNRPFLFFIQNEQGHILFMGAVRNME